MHFELNKTVCLEKIKAAGGKSEVARRVGVSRHTLDDWLANTQEPKSGNFMTLCQVLGVAHTPWSLCQQRSDDESV